MAKEKTYMMKADDAFLKWIENSKGVVHLIDAWLAGVEWANEHPKHKRL